MASGLREATLNYLGQGFAGTRKVIIQSIDNATDTVTDESTGTNTSTTGVLTAVATTDVTIAAGSDYVITVQLLGGAVLNTTVDFLKSVVITYDQP